MWHIETDLFAIAVFLIMFIKEFALHKERRQIQEQGLLKTNVQSDAFYVVLLLSIVSVIIDLVSLTAMNMASNWWVFQITMTVYVVNMPLLAATWVGYAYVLIHKDDLLGETLKKMTVIMLPYAAYSLLALTPVHGSFLHAFRKHRIQKRSPLYARGSRLYYAVFLYRTDASCQKRR